MNEKYFINKQQQSNNNIIQNYNNLEYDLISDNPFKNYYVVEKPAGDDNNKKDNNKNNKFKKKEYFVLKVQKKTNKSIKELQVLQKIGIKSNHVVSIYGYYKGVNRMMKPRLLSDNDELLFIEYEDMGKYQTLEMIIQRKKCKGSLIMTRFIMRGILASAYYLECNHIIHQTLHPGNIYIQEDLLSTNDQSVVKFGDIEHCLILQNNGNNNSTTPSPIGTSGNVSCSDGLNDRFVLGKDSVCFSIYSDRHQVRNLFKVVSANTISFTIGIIYLELLISTIYDYQFQPDEYISSLREIVRNGKLDIYTNKSTNLKYLRFNSKHLIEITDNILIDIQLISTLLQDQSNRPTIKQFIILNC